MVSASDALQPKQFVHHTELAKMYSGDFDEPMSKVLPAMRDWGHPSLDTYKPDGTTHGTTDRYVAHLAKDIKANGMREPIEVRGGNVITDGHHRALAAMKIKMDHVPVRHVQ